VRAKWSYLEHESQLIELIVSEVQEAKVDMSGDIGHTSAYSSVPTSSPFHSVSIDRQAFLTLVGNKLFLSVVSNNAFVRGILNKWYIRAESPYYRGEDVAVKGVDKPHKT
jgi:hypothetical protein